MPGAEFFFLSFFPALFGFILGACLGSFSSALLWRLPQRKPWGYETDNGKFKDFVRSECTSCHRILGTADLIPVLSWILQRGKCRTCHKKISAIYPVLEITSGFAGAFIMLMMGPGLVSLMVMFILTFTMIYFLTGLRYGIWPREILIILLFLSVVFVAFTRF